MAPPSDSCRRTLGEKLRERGSIDRLDEVHVEPRRLGAQAVFAVAVTSERDEEDLVAAELRAYAPCDLDAVEARQTEIDQRDVRTLVERERNRRGALVGFEHLMAVREREQHAQRRSRIAIV